MSNDYKQGDVWLSNVLLRGSSQSKQRPVVLVGNEIAVDIDIIRAPVTSQEARGEFDVVLEYWKEAGLVKPSIVQC
jgi:mRNA interferase MazF